MLQPLVLEAYWQIRVCALAIGGLRGQGPPRRALGMDTRADGRRFGIERALSPLDLNLAGGEYCPDAKIT